MRHTGAMKRASRLAAAAVAAAAVLSACGSVQPGSAVIVNGEGVSVSDVDIATKGFCAVGTVQSAPGTSVTVIDSSRQALNQLVFATVADQLAEDAGIEVKPLSLNDAQLAQLEEVFGPELADEVVATNELIARVTPIATELGAGSADAGLQIIQDAALEADLEFNPRYGVSSLSAEPDDVASLAVASPTWFDEPTSVLQCPAPS